MAKRKGCTTTGKCCLALPCLVFSCRAVPCLAVLCLVMLCCALLCRAFVCHHLSQFVPEGEGKSAQMQEPVVLLGIA